MSVLELIKDVEPKENRIHKWNIESIIKYTVDSRIKEDEKIKKIVDYYIAGAEKDLDEELGTINVDLDGRYRMNRTSETNLGNFLCDIILANVQADCAIINGGALRSDKIHPAGVFKKRDLRSILAFDSQLVGVKVTGKELHELLEHGVARYHDIGGSLSRFINRGIIIYELKSI